MSNISLFFPKDKSSAFTPKNQECIQMWMLLFLFFYSLYKHSLYAHLSNTLCLSSISLPLIRFLCLEVFLYLCESQHSSTPITSLLSCILGQPRKKQRFYSTLVKTTNSQSALVLFSGGQDSTTCLFWALHRFSYVEAVCIQYGQRHQQEVDIARAIAKEAGVPFSVIDAGIIGKISPSALTRSVAMDREVPANGYPNTFVPGRNLLFINLVAIIAYTKGIQNIVLGVSQADYSGYPDCRQEFIQSTNTTINLAMDCHFKIHTPLMHLSKAETWQLADEMGVMEIVQNKTLTCYNGIPADGCGECPSCKLRRKGLDEYLQTKNR